MGRFFSLASFLSLAFFASQADAIYKCENQYSVEEFENPFGTCAASGHLWVAEKCQEGYLCKDTTGFGCHITCPGNLYLYANVEFEFWDCVEPGRLAELQKRDLAEKQRKEEDLKELSDDGQGQPRFIYCPIGGYEVFTEYDPFNTPAPPSPGEVTENPIGTCHCDGEFWLAEGCKYAFLCNSTESIGGHYISCPNEGEVVEVNFETREWSCSTNIATCPGGAIEGAGCTMPECVYSNNPFGPCDCDRQFYINDDCSEGFLCTTNIPDPYLYDGCLQKCFDGQILKPDFTGKSFECVTPDNYPTCPGRFHLNCPEDDVGQDFDSSVCECENGMLVVSGDCTEGFYCQSRLPGGGVDLQCAEDEIITIDFAKWDWECSKLNTDHCPGLGGFKVGCDNGGSITAPPLKCEDTDFVMNPLGQCGGCEGQIFINDDCTESFYCSQYTPDESSNGCYMKCPDGQRVHIDLVTKEWDCIEREPSPDFLCPGAFAVDCPEEDNTVKIECECRNEFWINEDCTQGFMCSGPMEDMVNPGNALTCPDDRPIIVPDLTFGGRASCEPDANQCPGSYHFGCAGGDNPGETTTADSGDTTTGGASGLAVSSFILVAAFLERCVR